MTGDRKRLNPVLIFKDLITFTPERVKITPIGYISRGFFSQENDHPRPPDPRFEGVKRPDHFQKSHGIEKD